MHWVYSDGGRSAAGYASKKVGDCVTRATAIATELPYQVVYARLTDGVSTERRMKNYRRALTAGEGVHTRRVWFKRYLESMGWKWTPTMRIGSGCKVHLRDGELPMGRLIVSVSRHMVAVIDGVIHDKYDPSRGGKRCVYGYWSKPT